MTPYGRGKYGNGRSLTPTESGLLRLLSPSGFVTGHVVSTGKDRPAGCPTNYKIDLAHPGAKIAIEIDGSSHKGRAASDARKDSVLVSKGWRVLRFPEGCDLSAASRACIDLLSRR